MERLISLLGLSVFIGIAWALSEHRRRIAWRTVLGGLALQFGIAVFTLRTAWGHDLFDLIGRAFKKLLGFADQGTSMVFGSLTSGGFVFAITVTGTIVLVSALSSLLYHYGVLQRVVRGAAWAMRLVMGTSGSESLAAAANIFMGQTEAPLVIKPYLPTMTRSELMALMVGGMATIAGGVLAAYVALKIDAGHLLTASIMSAPAALMMSKLLLPETEVSDTAVGANAKIERESVNGLDAMCTGASDGIKLAINVMGMLIAFVALVALVNYTLSLGLRGIGVQEAKPLKLILGYANAPFAWLMGVPWADCKAVGAILGERIVLNEFIGYTSLSEAVTTQAISPRSITLTTYALCGFANFSSIAIQIGGISALSPERRGDLAKLGLKAMIGGLLACYCTAAMAGLVG
jgi:concentrative nucleoside transporter, CNT family